jgi:uncharacterized membrane protein
MNLLESIAKTLRLCVILSVILAVIGLIAEQMGSSYGEGLTWLAVLILILSPFMGVIAATISLASQKDRKWAAFGAVLIIVSLMGMAIALIR